MPSDDRLSFKVIDLVRRIKVHFMLSHNYSGRETKEIEIATQTCEFEFGCDFEVAKKYLVYAGQNRNEKSELIVKGCGRSRRVEDATEDLRILATSAPRKFD